MYTYTTVFSKVKETRLGRMISRIPDTDEPEPSGIPVLRHRSPPPDDDIHRFDELLDDLDCPVNTEDYNTVPLLRPPPVEPTFSVVEMHQPCLATPDPEGDN
jgi:hypothetical protein